MTNTNVKQPVNTQSQTKRTYNVSLNEGTDKNLSQFNSNNNFNK